MLKEKQFFFSLCFLLCFFVCYVFLKYLLQPQPRADWLLDEALRPMKKRKRVRRVLAARRRLCCREAKTGTHTHIQYIARVKVNKQKQFLLEVFKLYSFLLFCIKGTDDVFTFCSFLLTGNDLCFCFIGSHLISFDFICSCIF